MAALLSVNALCCSNGGGTSPGSGAGGAGAGGSAGAGGTAGSVGSAGAGAGGSAGSAGSAGSDGDGGPSARPHPLYPALDLDTLPGEGGGAVGPYEPPTLPTTTRTVSITTTGNQARTDLLAACQIPRTAVSVAASAGRIGGLDFGNVTDCDVTLAPGVIADFVYVGHLPGPTVAPAHRLRVRGGQIGSIVVDPGSTDIVFDGVTVNNAVLPPAQRSGTAIYLINSGTTGFVNRFAFVNSIIRMVATLPSGGDSDGCAYLAGGARNVFFANDNIVTAGNRNSWGFRIGGGSNFIIIDSTVRVSFHKLIRMNDGPVDYVFVKRGTWLREATLTGGGLALNDSFAQLGDLGTDRVYIHDPAVYLLSTEPVAFGASSGPGQAGKSWEARRIAWHARSSSVISDARLSGLAAACTSGATCDYGIGTHTYDYDPGLGFPTNPWRSLPEIAEDNPDALSIAP